MKSDITWSNDVTTPEQTIQLAEALGRALHGGEVIELVSDLGGGKTTFTRGLASGFGSTDRVASPTFTLSRVYKATEGRAMHHFDFYRLPEAGLIAEELADVLQDPQNVVVVEWAGIVQDVLPPERLTITITPTADGRHFAFSAPEQLEYLIKAVQ
jgi:tRNA threonylcarbamoyladenosine biosynthesis protein TsaE